MSETSAISDQGKESRSNKIDFTLHQNYIATWTQFGFVDNPTVTSRCPNKTVSATYSVYVDYNQINSTAAPFNLMIQFNVQYNDAGVPMYYKIDGVQYNVGYTSASEHLPPSQAIYGTHTVILYGVGHYLKALPTLKRMVLGQPRYDY